MAAIPGVRFNLTGSSGSQAALVPKQSWRTYVFPRGAYASQDSTGTVITFDTAGIASRFAALDWIQVGLSTGNIRQVSAVGGNSIAVSGSAVTVSENNRVFLVGTTQPTTSGGSTTYLVPRTTIYNRDDDGSDRFTNSMVTSDSDGLIAFYGPLGIYDCLIQDGNQSNQGFIADLAVGVEEGISTSFASVFGATVTFNAAIGVTGNARFSGGVSFTSTVDHTGTDTFSGPTYFNRANPNNLAIGVTGLAEFNTNITVGTTATIHGALGVTGTLTAVGITASGDLAAAGGFRCQLGPWQQVDVPAAQSSAILYLGTTASLANYWVPSRAGSVVGLAGFFVSNITGGTATLEFAIGSSLIGTSLQIGVLAGSSQYAAMTITKDQHPFGTPEILELRLTTVGLAPADSNDFAGWMEVEQ